MMRNIVLIWKESRVIPWLFSLSWEQRKVGDILSDVERPIAMLDDETYQLVTVKRRNEGIVSRGYLKGKDILVKNYYRIHAGDFLISKRQVIHGANGYVPKSLDNAVVSNEYMVAVSNNDISTAFWALMSQRKEMYQMYLFSSYGVDVEKMVFNVDDWKKRSVIIPKLEEQTVIVSFFSKLDNLITLHHRQEKRSGHNPFQMQRRITFTWEQRKLGEIAEIVGGGTPSTSNPSYWDGDIDWYAPAEMEGQRYAVGSVRKITEAGLQNSSAKILPAHKTVLFTSRAGIGKMAILKLPGATNQGFQSLILKDGYNPYFIYSMGEEIKAKAEGVVKCPLSSRQ